MIVASVSVFASTGVILEINHDSNNPSLSVFFSLTFELYSESEVRSQCLIIELFSRLGLPPAGDIQRQEVINSALED